MNKWISVDERLPEIETTEKGWGNHRVDRSVRVLCACKQKSGKVLVKEGYYELFDFKREPTWRIPGSIDSVTHWMPLPEPPKVTDCLTCRYFVECEPDMIAYHNDPCDLYKEQTRRNKNG